MEHPILDMLKAYFKEETLEMDSSVEEELLLKAKEQALLPYIYLVYQKKEYKAYYVSAAIRQEEFLKLQKELTLLFNEAKIHHFYLKGSVLCNIYPDPTLRTRGDIDVLVDPDDINKAKEILLQQGYEVINIESQHHMELIKNGYIVELHFSFFDSYRTLDYFKNPFNLVELIDSSYYALRNEDHFLFCLHHFANHLRKGAGIRYILDFYYMLKKLPLDQTKLHSIIEKSGYNKLYNNILNVIYILTGEEFDSFSKENIDFFLEYLLKSGIHGFGEENEIEEKGFGMKNYKLKAIMAGTFLTDKGYRLLKYPRLGKHWYTYPLCLIHRILYLIVTQPIKVFKLLFGKKNKVSKEEQELYKKLGLDS